MIREVLKVNKLLECCKVFDYQLRKQVLKPSTVRVEKELLSTNIESDRICCETLKGENKKPKTKGSEHESQFSVFRKSLEL